MKYLAKYLFLILAFSTCLLHAEQLSIELPLPLVTVERDSGDAAMFMDFNGQYYSVPGAPELPVKNFKVLLPPEADLKSVRVFISYEHLQKVPGFWLVKPAQPRKVFIAGNNEDSGVENTKTQNIYQSDCYFPESLLFDISTGQMREFKIVDIPISLFRYNPVRRDLRRLTSGTLVIEYERCTPDIKPKSPIQDIIAEQYLKDKVLNYQQYAFAYQNLSLRKSGPPSPKGYAIITTSAIVSGSNSLLPFVDHKQQKGFSVHLVTENSWGGGVGNKASENIHKWLKNNYLSLNIEYVLLIGNPHPTFGNVPMKMLWPRYSASSLRESPSDLYYADLTGEWDLNKDGIFGEYPNDFGAGGVDLNWEVVVGRIPVYSSLTDLDAILNKIMAFENTRQQDCGWRQNVLLPMKPLDSYVTGHLLGEQIKNEIIQPKGGWHYYRIYEDDYNLVPPPELSPCTLANVTAQWKDLPFGAIFWATNGTQDKANDVMDINHVTQLNDTHPGFTFQCSCYNSYPENTTNLSYSLLKQGAIATIGATRVSWYARKLTNYAGSATNMGMVYEYAKRLITNEMPCGYALQDLKSSLHFWLGEDWMNIVGFNLYGDPSIGLYSYQEVVIPQYDLTITISGPGQVKTTTGTICNDVCIEYINEGETVKLTALAAANCIFSHWSGAGVKGRGNPCVLKMNSSQAITAHFVETPREDHIHVMAVKFNTSSTSEPDLSAFESQINSLFAQEMSVDLVITPEYSLSRTGGQDMGSPGIEFDYNETSQTFNIKSGQEQKRAVTTIGAIQALALKHSTNFILGTVAESAGGYLFNSQLIINHEGKIIGIRRKVGDFVPVDETARRNALQTVCSYTLKSQRGRAFTVLPTIGQDAVEVSDVWDALSALNADIIAHSERMGYALYQPMTLDIYNHLFDANKYNWIPILRDIFIQHFVTERNAVTNNNGYLIVADGSSVTGGMINLNQPPRAPSFLSSSDLFLYGILELQTTITLYYDFPEAGWYMLSVPGEAADMQVSALFPDAVSGIALSYENNAYFQVKTLETGKGYWLFFMAPSHRSFEVKPIRVFSRHLPVPGWYMLGSVMEDTDFTRPLVAPHNGVRLPILSYDKNTDKYVPQYTLISQQAYWIINLRNCYISTQKDPGLNRALTQETDQEMNLTPPPCPDFSKILLPEAIPQEFRINQNFPNPFNDGTTIVYQLPNARRVTVTIYNIRGEKVRILENTFKESGYFQLNWNGEDENGETVTSGVYFIRIQAGEDQQTIKATLMR